MLYEFLLEHRAGILSLCESKASQIAGPVKSSELMDRGLPVLFDELLDLLQFEADHSADERADRMGFAAVSRGKESLRLGYTLSQVVHGYGALCQAITQYAAENSGDPILAKEFNLLNLTLDSAIADAVAEFDRGQRANLARQEVLRLGALAHELRNSLSNAAMAFRMMQKGHVGANGDTSRVLEESHRRMKEIIDRSLAEVRLQGEPKVERERCRVIHLISEVEVTAAYDAGAKSIQLQIEVLPDLEVFVDRHLVVSAIANIVQNAI